MSQHFTHGFVTVINRTKTPREVRYDGQTGKIPPYPAKTLMSAIAADRAFSQNRIAGTENPYDPAQFESYIGIEEWAGRCPCSPIENDTPTAAESLDRSQLPPMAQGVTLVTHGRQRPENVKMDDPAGVGFGNMGPAAAE